MHEQFANTITLKKENKFVEVVSVGTHVRSLNSGKTYMCLKESMAMTGQSAGVFWIWSRGWRNFSQSACKKLMEPAEDAGRL